MIINPVFKFRVWDAKAKVMLYPDVLALFNPGVGYSGANTCLGVGADDPDLMPYTNLKDNHGKEIYAGDILKCKIKDGWFKEETIPILMEVKLEQRPQGESITAGYLYIPNDREVIGNIKENPDLIKALTLG